MFNGFEMLRRTLKTVLRIFLRTCKTVSIKTFINREDKSKRSKFSYTAIVETRTTNFLEVVTPPSIYHYQLPHFSNTDIYSCIKNECYSFKHIRV